MKKSHVKRSVVYLLTLTSKIIRQPSVLSTFDLHVEIKKKLKTCADLYLYVRECCMHARRKSKKKKLRR